MTLWGGLSSTRDRWGCVATYQFAGNHQNGIASNTITGGRCAVLRHVGSDDALGETVRLLFEEWFPQSGEIRRDFPLFFQRVKFPPEVSEEDSLLMCICLFSNDNLVDRFGQGCFPGCVSRQKPYTAKESASKRAEVPKPHW